MKGYQLDSKTKSEKVMESPTHFQNLKRKLKTSMLDIGNMSKNVLMSKTIAPTLNQNPLHPTLPTLLPAP